MKKGEFHEDEFTKMIFSWSLDDILNQHLYYNKVESIPLTFESEEHYFGSFVYHLLEEARSELASSMEIMHRAPFADMLSFNESTSGENRVYDVIIGPWKNQYSKCGRDDYDTLPGDLLLLVDGKPESVSHLKRVGRTWALAMVKSKEDDSTSMRVKTAQPLEFQDGMLAVFLMNVTSQKRIWNSLRVHRNLDIIKEVIYSDFKVKENCSICSFGFDNILSAKYDPRLLLNLNESQKTAVMAALCKTQCCHTSSVEQIWGPPGTGKTLTVGVLLFSLLQMKQRTLTCAPTNVAILQLASRMLSLVRESSKTTIASGDSFCSVGDLLLFGSKERLEVSTDIEEIHLEHRVKRIAKCLGPVSGWKHCIRSMINFLENCVPEYYSFIENEFLKEKQLPNENEDKRTMLEMKSFSEFVQERFSSLAPSLKRCILTFCTHIPRNFMGESIFQNMISLLDNISSLESLLFHKNLVSEELEDIFNSKPLQDDFVKSLSVLRTLQVSLEGLALPCFSNKYAIKQFCFQRASVIFCTTSSSYKLHAVNMEPLNILVIDEAAQLKEAESTIPLQLPGMKHAILIGDERQLPAMVNSNVCIESGYGRSLFDRLSFLGHPKHLLNIQYRMHPSISCFPNLKFYQNQILDAQNVLSESYGKRYLSGPMFGSYSFINVVGGKEEKDDDGRSRRNMVEVSIVIKIVKNLYKAWQDSQKKLTIGVISPYAAQVASIQEKLAHMYEKLDGFSVKVKSIDGFQGGEEDIIILSTVRSNIHGSLGFISSPQRTNVALTRARHCLWILGNERTLTNSESIWKDLVSDARKRHCFFDADADECLKMTIIGAKKELKQLDDLVNGNSILFEHAKWKVLFSNDFRRSFGKLTRPRLKKQVINLLLKLSSGWRPKNRSVDLSCENSSQILKQFKVEGIYVICTIDIIKEVNYTQVLKVWNILPLEEISEFRKRLESIFSAYSDHYINRCSEKCFEGNLEVPKCWPASQKIIRFRYLSDCEDESEVSVNPGNARNYVENSKVSESLLLMKFYSLSRGVVSHLLSGDEVDIPMQVTDEQMDIILSGMSSFIIGRSGTGKTTILTMKLFQHEQIFRIASNGINEAESSRVRDGEVEDDPEISKPSVIRQLFVTVSPKLCYAVKQNVSHLTSSSSGAINLDNADVIPSEFNDIPDTFINIPVKHYPLVITFQKFLTMLDGTLGSSFFERFLKARENSILLQTLIRLREVTFDRFCSLYWPHFNTNLTKNLDSSRVFTEIISHIKGGLKAGEYSDGKLSYEGYCLLAETRSSTLCKEKREIVYTLFETYEKMKSERGEFDLGDLVNDIHHRLKNGIYEGDQMDLVYIDEVQDLSMRQISLFKYICQNVEEGFMFAGDTAQTIARGIDFRFQDIRSLFYKEFLSTRTSGEQHKGRVSEIKQLKENFRTHAGVLDLAQSVIDMLYHYYIHSVDKLDPEISLISGEAPVLLESGDDENAIVTIFGGSGSGSGEDIVGFGAEQVILVRDDHAKTEVCEIVGKNALVLTIVECKGLEFHDVLLYNFFGTSPLKDQWRVLYGYMKMYDWLDDKLPQSFPAFNEARHSVLCSELKQLYVAITRTRQRLWICENREELSKPMFNYWKKRGLVQVKKLDDSVAQAMRVASSPHEWRERGKKFFYGNNFVMATMCFERAGDTMWEKLAKASGLRASAYQMRGTNHEAFTGCLREAALMFESIGKHQLAATCYCDLGEYERAGKIYMHRCGRIDLAAECFSLAEAHTKGDQLSNCLSVCKSVKLFGLEEVEQEFLENCALDYHELLLLKQESGHFLEDAELVRSSGALLKEADLLEKAGKFKEAALLLLWYVFISSLWGDGNISWPLKQFAQKEELGNKVKLLAKSDSGVMYNFVCSELKLHSDEYNSLPELKEDLCVSRNYRSLRGEIMLIRKILDKHVQMNSSNFDWEDKLPVDIYKFCEDKMFQNRVSVRTLVFYWNMWKKHISDILRSVKSLEIEEAASVHADFCLYYFGVRKQFLEGNTVYVSLNKEADWIRYTCNKGLQRDEKRMHFDGREMVSAIRSYWQSQLLSVGIKVLETLEALHKSKSNGSVFHQSTSLLHIFEVSKFLLDFECHNLANPYRERLQHFLEISLCYIDIVFPLDWRKSVDEDLVSLRETDLSVNLLEEIILQTVDIEALERVIIICLCSKVSVAVCKNLIKKLKNRSQWKSFVEEFMDRGLKDVSVARALQHALDHSFGATSSFLSLHSFGYLLDRLLLMHSFSSRNSYTTRSTFVGSLTHIQSASTLSVGQSSLNLTVMIERIEDILYCSEFGIGMIQRSKIDHAYYPLLVLKMVMILSLICLKFPAYSHRLLRHLSGYGNYAYFLPKKFVSCLSRKSENEEWNLTPKVVAEAFSSIDDPLLIISSEDGSPKINAPCAIFVDLRKSKEEIMTQLFPRKNTPNVSTSSNAVNGGAIPEGPFSETLPDTDMNMNRVLKMNWKVIEEISKAINQKKRMPLNKLPAATRIMNELDTSRATFLLAATAKSSCPSLWIQNFEKFVFLVNESLKMLSFAFDTRSDLQTLKLLSCAFHTSVTEYYYTRRLFNYSIVKDNNLAIVKDSRVVEDDHSMIWNNLGSAVDFLQKTVRHVIELYYTYLNDYVMNQVTKVEETGDEASAVLENQNKRDNTQDGIKEKGKENNKSKKNKKKKGKKKHY